MIYLFSGILMLGFLVFVHELGHFCIAKWSGVKVLKFSLGFGPKLVSKQWGETEYLICSIPLGGYVQMFGEGGGEAGESAELTPEERERSFADKPLGKRVAIVAAGPIMNLLLPFLLLPISYMIGVNVPAFLDAKPCVGYVYAPSAAEQAGFLPGDCILSVNGDEVDDWSSTNQALISHVGAPLKVRILRGQQELDLVLSSDVDNIENLQLRNLGIFPPREAVVGVAMPGRPAHAAGIQVGDRILSIGDEPVSSWYDLSVLIQGSKGAPQIITVQRGSSEIAFTIKPALSDEGNRYLIGIEPKLESAFKRYGFVDSVKTGVEQAFDIIDLTLVFIQKLFSGQVSSQNIGGPIMVFQMAGQAAQTGITTVLTMMAFLSIQLGILNLLPIPILDGGHLFFYLCEFVFRRPLSMRAREMAQQVGLILLLMLMVLAFYNDIMRMNWIADGMDWLGKIFGSVAGG